MSRKSIPEVPVEEGPPPKKKRFRTANVSIDDMLQSGLQAIRGIMKSVYANIKTGSPSRETVMNLKDCMSMLYELKKKEKEFLDSMTDEELEKMVTDQIDKKKSE